ncbi:helix-turn-helix domain-containing protein [Liquorilactobacillus satsumensis]|uniref:helix-turn-helix domain-containing protein n=1 Tax=Liquorilactobacillus satsumensis TaxID=259059 RepID=UPI0039E94CE3
MDFFNNKEIGSNIEKYRNKRRLLQGQLAERIGVSGKATISNWVQGISKPDKTTLKQIADFFEIGTLEIMFKNGGTNEELRSFFLNGLEILLDSIKKKKLGNQHLNKSEKQLLAAIQTLYVFQDWQNMYLVTQDKVASELMINWPAQRTADTSLPRYKFIVENKSFRDQLEAAKTFDQRVQEKRNEILSVLFKNVLIDIRQLIAQTNDDWIEQALITAAEYSPSLDEEDFDDSNYRYRLTYSDLSNTFIVYSFLSLIKGQYAMSDLSDERTPAAQITLVQQMMRRLFFLKADVYGLNKISSSSKNMQSYLNLFNFEKKALLDMCGYLTKNMHDLTQASIELFTFSYSEKMIDFIKEADFEIF